ncbi:MAG: bifunctional 5,10-methylenetetrahydrofolate dehydrogenase/5,10-methenyltetrahydrofolate cyclohydrolase [Elusimicrobiales bacterium]
MAATILEGKTLAAQIRAGLGGRIEAAAHAKGRGPLLAAVHCPGDAASDLYLKKELEACAKTGIASREHQLKPDCPARDFARLLRGLSEDKSVDAVLVPRPLPPQMSAPQAWEGLDPAKDIDGACALSMGRLFLCKNFGEIERGGFFAPCTAMAVVRLLRHHGIEISGKKAAVAGRSSTVGRPLAHMLVCLDATVTVCHTRTPDIASVFKSADMVISAAGKARWVRADMLRPGTVVADVGTNTDENGVFCGDVDYAAAEPLAAAITPVPGGVGPVTLACLLENIVSAFERG